MADAKASQGTKPGLLIGIAVAAALVLVVLFSVLQKPPPVEDSAPLEAKLDGMPQDTGAASGPETMLGK